MGTPILLVATATRWYGTARMPRALTRAGFDVTLLAPRDTLAESSRYVAKVVHLDDAATPLQWVDAFTATVKAIAPPLVMPCDDMAFQLLQTLALSPPNDMPSTLAIELGALIRHSLGEPAHYRKSVDKTLLSPSVEALGVRVPPYAIVERLEEAEAFAATHGYPLVVKRDRSSAGSGVAICVDRARLADAMKELARVSAEDIAQSSSGRLIVQAHIAGRTTFYPTMTWKGTMLSGYAGEKLEGFANGKGPPTVNRYFRSAELRAMSEKIAAGFATTGFYSIEFLEESSTGLSYLLEINRRLVGGAHRGSAIGVDHCAALHAALLGKPSPTRGDLDEGEEHFTVHFPQEWLRDPGSRWLRERAVDVPWDDPGLIKAMLALRHQR